MFHLVVSVDEGWKSSPRSGSPRSRRRRMRGRDEVRSRWWHRS